MAGVYDPPYPIPYNPIRGTTSAPAGVMTAYNVKDFGAVGDGVHDDTEAIQAATNAAAVAVGGGLVYVPPESYKVSSPITLQSNVWLMGTGASSVLMASSTFPVSSQTGIVVIGGITQQQVTDIAFDSTAIANTNLAAVYSSTYTTHLRIENLTLELGGNLGIHLNGLGINGDSYDLVFRNITAHNGAGTIALYLNGDNGASYHGVRISDIYNYIDAIGITDDRVAVVGNTPGGTGGLVYDVFVDNVQIVCDSSSTGLVNGVKVDTGVNTYIRGISIRGVQYTVASTTAANGKLVYGLQEAGSQVQDIHVSDCLGWGTQGVSLRLYRQENSPYIIISNVALKNCVDPNAGIEIEVVSAPVGDEIILVTNCVVESQFAGSYGTYTPVGIAIAPAASGAGAGGSIVISNCAINNGKYSITNNILPETDELIGGLNTNMVVTHTSWKNTNVPLFVEGSLLLSQNPGYNPVGSAVPGTAFALPASGTAWTNNTGVDGTLFVTAAGTVTDVVVQGVTVGSSLAVGQSFFVAAGGTFTLTYSVAPTLVFVGN